jgi:hypothetical protein
VTLIADQKIALVVVADESQIQVQAEESCENEMVVPWSVQSRLLDYSHRHPKMVNRPATPALPQLLLSHHERYLRCPPSSFPRDQPSPMLAPTPLPVSYLGV